MPSPEAARRRHATAATVRAWLALLLGLALSACAIQLVPDYDPALVEGLEQANEQAEVLFAKLEGGSGQDAFPRYEDAYAGLIGSFESLRLRAQARPIPPLAKRLSKIGFVQGVCGDASSCINASPESIGNVLFTLRGVRDAHRRAGLEPGAVVDLHTEYVTAIRQALTVETALER